MSANMQLAERIETAPSAPVNETAALISMIERAARDPSVDVEKFERLMTMKERVEAQAAKKAFNAAISAAKGEIGPIIKNRVVDFSTQKGRTNYRHEDFAEVARTVDPVLNRYGLSYRFKTTQDGTRLRVTCIISHSDGYSEETTLESSEDHSGNKNSIQAIGSAATYLQRYTLKLALGLSAAEVDDDGRSAGGSTTISEDQLGDLRLALIRVGADIDANTAKFCAYFKVASLDLLPARDFDRAMKAIKAKEGARHD